MFSTLICLDSESWQSDPRIRLILAKVVPGGQCSRFFRDYQSCPNSNLLKIKVRFQFVLSALLFLTQAGIEWHRAHNGISSSLPKPKNYRSFCQDFPAGPVVENPSASAGDVGSVLGQEDSTCRGTTGLCTTATEPAL